MPMILFHGFGSTNFLATLRPGLTSPSARMGLIPNPARSSREPAIKAGALASLPTEIILQIIEDGNLTPWDRVCFAASCKRFKNITYPCLYRRFDWIAPFNVTCSLGLTSGFGLLVEIFLEPVVSGFSMMFGLGPPPDIHKNSFEEKAEFVREMSVLGGYQYYKDMGILTRYYGILDNGDPFIDLFEPFQNLRRIELDERAALTWTGYLRVVASILVSKPTLEDLVLRHRLGKQPDNRCKMPADMTEIQNILSKGILAKLQSLIVILGRRFEPTEMGYEYFHQLMEVFEGATTEVTVFKLFANYSKLDETDPILVDGIWDDKACTPSEVKVWSFPKLREIEIHTHNFPTAGAIRCIKEESLAHAKRLKFVCDIMETDLDTLSKNLSSFQNIEELNIWDPQWPQAPEYSSEELLPICEKLSSLKENFERLDKIYWTLGYQKFKTHCAIKYPVESKRPVIKFSRSKGATSTEHIISTLPQPLRYIKEGYILTRS
ncbi:hypothetical protein TWF281_011668 [Arthrobotrys megalospora]